MMFETITRQPPKLRTKQMIKTKGDVNTKLIEMPANRQPP